LKKKKRKKKGKTSAFQGAKKRKKEVSASAHPGQKAETLHSKKKKNGKSAP